MPNTELERLRVAVTGGTSGLGLALVRLLVARGAHVAFVARTARAVERTASETAACGIVGDIGRKEDIYPIALQSYGQSRRARCSHQQRIEPRTDSARAPCRHGMRGARAGTRGELVGSVPFDQGAVRRPRRFRDERTRRGRDQHFQRRGGRAPYPGWGAYGASKAALRHLTAIWAEEAKADGVTFPLDRSRRHGYAAARAGRAGCRSDDAETASGLPRRKSSRRCSLRCRATPIEVTEHP